MLRQTDLFTVSSFCFEVFACGFFCRASVSPVFCLRDFQDAWWHNSLNQTSGQCPENAFEPALRLAKMAGFVGRWRFRATGGSVAVVFLGSVPGPFFSLSVGTRLLLSGTLFPPFLVGRPTKTSLPKKGFPFSRVTEQQNGSRLFVGMRGVR